MGKKNLSCPEHGEPWFITDTQYGRRAHCPVDGCTYVWWMDNDTSRPADQATRTLRHETHQIFDAIWESKLMGRNAAYRELAAHLGIRVKRCHIGMFDQEQCRRTQAFARELVGGTVTHEGGGDG